MCLFDEKHPDRNKPTRGEKKPYRDSVLERCRERDDVEAREIERRVLSCSDFIAAEARYHESCRNRFNLSCQKTMMSPGTRGWPVNSAQQQHFETLCEWLETEGELHTLKEIHQQLTLIADSDEVYSEKSIKRKLQEKYGNEITFNELDGRCNVACLSKVSKYLINKIWYKNRMEDDDEESKRIISTAVKILVSELRLTKFDCGSYPPNEEISDVNKNIEWLPPNLRIFMQTLIKSPIKQASIGQCIVNAVRPRSTIPPLLFGLGIEMDHVFGSKWQISELNKLGYCVRIDEVTRYKQSVLMNESTIDWLKRSMRGTFQHWIADNVDHNVCTLDGKGTLHGMGIVGASTGMGT